LVFSNKGEFGFFKQGRVWFFQTGAGLVFSNKGGFGFFKQGAGLVFSNRGGFGTRPYESSHTLTNGYSMTPRRKTFLVFGSPCIDEADIREVVATMESGWLGTGPKTAQFEADIKQYKHANYSAAVNSCTAALHLSILAAGIRPGDEVITTPMTFCATVNAIIHAKATPVLADVDPVTMNISPAAIEKKITAKTRAILPVHFAGRACDMDAIMATAGKHDLKVIEDCAHAIETEYKGRHVGSIGDFGCLSFYVTKNIITGEGGMVLAKKEEDIAQIKILALHGMSKDAWKRFSDEGFKHYQVVEAGFKYNMMDLQAAIGIQQLKRIEPYWLRRKEIWDRYNEAFADLPIGLPAAPEPDTRHAFHLYTLMIDEKKAGISRDAFLNAMTAQNIGVGVHYLSLPEHPFYQKTYGWKPQEYPHAMRIGQQTVSLPLSAKLTDEDVTDVIGAVRTALRH
jgi:dTDP-4-amino-4,6-dideoxygalactose transaminase